MRADFDDLHDALKNSLTSELPGTQAHLTMAPAYRMEASQAKVQNKNCRKAGVLLVIVPSKEHDEPAFVLTKRREHLPDHPGQISLPGGQQLEGESLESSALRETEEEIGLVSKKVTVIGSLTPLYIPPTSFCVYPFVGMVKHQPRFIPQADEVDTIYEVPLSELVEDRTLRAEKRVLHDTAVKVPYFHLQNVKVWGATAMILAEFREVYQHMLTHFCGRS